MANLPAVPARRAPARPAAPAARLGPATGTALVRVRLTGPPAAVAAVAAALGRALDVADVSRLYPSRDDPGVRLYLTALAHQNHRKA